VRSTGRASLVVVRASLMSRASAAAVAASTSPWNLVPPVLSVVVPVYNEESGLRDTLATVGRRLAELRPGDFEIVVSDDGSRDRSAAIATEMAKELPIQVLRAESNRGKGAAVRAGMLAAKGDPVFFFDADLSTPLAEMAPFLAALESGADVVVGNRKHPDARIERPQPWLRVRLGLAYTRLTNLLLGLRVGDFTCGFKAFRASAAHAIFSRQRLERWSFDAEILFLAHRLGLRVKELPVTWSDRPDSRVRVGSAMVKSFAELLAIRRNAARGLYR
jgi:glycosyltransferase involved in cell wall biosynthesis